MAIVQSLMLGLSLASAAGLRAFLPLLALALAAKFNIVPVGGQFAWLHSWTAITVLGVATVAELLADKVPVIDHLLDTVQTVVRPAAGALAVAGTQSHVDPITAGVLGLILGAPLAGGIHVAKTGARVASTGLTAGLANPFLSLGEDGASLILSVLAIWVPLLAFALSLLLVLAVWRLWRRLRPRRKAAGLE